jgi:hypothetical protein
VELSAAIVVNPDIAAVLVLKAMIADVMSAVNLWLNINIPPSLSTEPELYSAGNSSRPFLLIRRFNFSKLSPYFFTFVSMHKLQVHFRLQIVSIYQ